MKIEHCGHISTPLPFMVFPQWLLDPDGEAMDLFEDEETAKEFYTLYFTICNPDCQKAIGSELMKRLTLLETVFNPYDYSKEALGFTCSTIERTVKLWEEDFANMLSKVVDGEDFWLIAKSKEGEPVSYLGSDKLYELLNGSLKVDFLSSHPSIRKNFIVTMRAKILTDFKNSVKN